MENLKKRFTETKKEFAVVCAVTFGVFALICVGSLLFYTPYVETEPVGQAVEKQKQPTYFAEIDKDGTVLRVIVADQAFIDSGAVGDPSNWKETHMDGKERYNYAEKGGRFDAASDAFIRKKPAPTATFDEQTKRWEVSVDETVIENNTPTR